MIILQNSALKVSIVDPADDRGLLGARYCTGGYVYQVEDTVLGPLFAGPEYPSAPSAINGQGIPDVFQYTFYDDPGERPPVKMIIGVGLLENTARQKAADLHFTLPVSVPCEWSVTSEADTVTMNAVQAHGGRSLAIERSLTLHGRTLRSTTWLVNTGQRELPFRWFAHPFFPRMATGESCRPGFSFRLPASDGFAVDSDGAIGLRKAFNWDEGCFQHLDGVEGQRFNIRQRHPLCGEIVVDGDFPLHRIALWANAHTFSIEPFLQHTLRPEEGYTWTLTYRL